MIIKNPFRPHSKGGFCLQILDSENGSIELVSGMLHLFHHLFAQRSQFVIFSRRSARRFYPWIGQKLIFFEAREERIERPFYDEEIVFLQSTDNIWSIDLAFTNNQQDEIFQNPFSHLNCNIIGIIHHHSFLI